MDKDEALRIALEALVDLGWHNENCPQFPTYRIIPHSPCTCGYDTAITALRQALEQPECNQHPDAPHGFNRDASHSLGRYVCDCEGWEQEPVAWRYTSQYTGNERYITRYQSDLTAYKAVDVLPLYTEPPKREWVGLTETERINLEILMIGQIQVTGLNVKGISNAIRAVEQVLKEKNHD